METYSIHNEHASEDALYTLASNLNAQSLEKLVKRLSKLVRKKQTKETEMSFEEALKLLDSMSVSTGQPVPPEEDGKHLRIEKYME